jgi:hypothetical protein
MHWGIVRVEELGNTDRYAVLPAIVEKQRLGAALRLTVAGSRPDDIDVFPVIFGSGVDLGIAINLAGGRLESPHAQARRETQHIDRADHPGLGRQNRSMFVLYRRRRTGEIMDSLDLDVERQRHDAADYFGAGVAEKSIHVLTPSRAVVVD